MGTRFEADGDTWEVALEEHAPHAARATAVFHCLSNPQRPYRVLPLPADVLGSGGRFGEDLGDSGLRELFSRSQIMDFTLDAEADPRRVERRTEP